MKGAEELIAKLRTIPDRICNERVIYFAAQGTIADVEDRVFGKGELTDGSKLTYKEDYEVWAYSPPAPRKVSGKGKPGKDGKAKKIKGGWYPTYLAFKKQQGRDQRPFELTAELRKAYSSGFAEGDEPCEAKVVLTAAAAAKWRGLTESKGEFLKLSSAERAGHNERVRDLYREILAKL